MWHFSLTPFVSGYLRESKGHGAGEQLLHDEGKNLYSNGAQVLLPKRYPFSKGKSLDEWGKHIRFKCQFWHLGNKRLWANELQLRLCPSVQWEQQQLHHSNLVSIFIITIFYWGSENNHQDQLQLNFLNNKKSQHSVRLTFNCFGELANLIVIT